MKYVKIILKHRKTLSKQLVFVQIQLKVVLTENSFGGIVIELKQLRYFIQINDDKSFSLAAKHLFLTQQALSKAIGNLEEELGVPLFDRNHAGLRITDYGNLLYEKAVPILEDTTSIVSEMAKLKKKLDRKVSIIVSFGVINALNPDLLTHFRLSHPEIDLVIRDYPDLICENRILEKQADLGLIVGPIQNELLESSLLLSEDLYLIMHKENDLAPLTYITIEDLRNHEYLLTSDDFKVPISFKACCKENGFVPKINYVSNELSFLERLVSFNKGIALVPKHHLSLLVDSNICAKKFPSERLHWNLYLVRGKERIHTPGLDVLWDYLLHNFNRYVMDF